MDLDNEKGLPFRLRVGAGIVLVMWLVFIIVAFVGVILK